ncbi:tandem-95 repeat protein, partial [Magnetospirillum sulfuroxidans]
MADENLTDASEENANSNAAPTENAQQALDDLTVLSDVGNQSLGESRLNLVRNVDIGDAAMGGLATIHQGSGSGDQVQQGLNLQAGLIGAEDIAIETAPPAPVVAAEVPPIETMDEAPAIEIIDPTVNLAVQDDLSAENIIFGEGITFDPVVEAEGGVEEEVVVEDAVIPEVVPEAVVQETFIDLPPVIKGIFLDPTLEPVPTPINWQEDETLRFGVDASDPDGGDVIISFSVPAHGVVTVNDDNTYSYQPSENYFGEDSFTVYVTDDEGNTVSQVVDLNIANVDDEAVITVTGGVGSESTDGGATIVTGSVAATDIDNDNAVADAIDRADIVYSFGVDEDGAPITTLTTAHGSVTIDSATGDYTFTASDNNWGGTDSFEVTTIDKLGGATTQEVSVTVIGVDDATVVTGPVDLGDMAEDSGSITITAEQLLANASDVDNALHVANVSVSGGDLVDNGDGTYTFTPAADFNGSIDVSYDVVTDDGVATSATASLDVTAVDDTAVVTSPTEVELTVDQDGSGSGDIDAVDADGDPLTYGIIDPATGELVAELDTEYGTVVIDPATGEYTFTANDHAATLDDNESATDGFQVAATDGHTVSEPQNVSVTITGSNDGPVVETSDALNLGENGSDSGVVTGSDIDASDTVSYYLLDENGDRVTTLTTDTGTMVIDPETGAYTFTASGQDGLNVGDTATDSFQVVAWDGTVASAPQDVSVTITGSDDATVVTGTVDLGDMAEDSGSITITAEQLLANASDVDNALHVANVSVSGGDLVDNGDGTYTFT